MQGSRQPERVLRMSRPRSFERRPPEMGKLEKFRMTGLSNAAESMGAGVPGRTALGSALHGATAAGPAAVPVQLQGVSRNKDAANIPTEKIGSDPTQPREEFDEGELDKLAESLRTRGQLQP